MLTKTEDSVVEDPSLSGPSDEIGSLPKPAEVSFWKQVWEDIDCVFERDPAARNRWEVICTYPGIHALFLYRIAHRLWKRRWFFLARLLSFFARSFTLIEIHPAARIGRRCFIDHGCGVVIGETAEIGDDVTLYHGVTLGGTSWNKGKRHPTLENGVIVGTGAKILGPVRIGQGSRIGANAVVIQDVPPEMTVVGIPGRAVIPPHQRRIPAHGIDLDHHLMPDPVGRAIERLLHRIQDLEAQVARLNACLNKEQQQAQARQEHVKAGSEYP
ncbi:MAG: serine O-acetyltransferase [Cyanobacteriota bacterium]